MFLTKGRGGRFVSTKRISSATDSCGPRHFRGKHGGHAAVAADVRRVWANFTKYLEHHAVVEHSVLDAMSNLSAVFEEMYSRRVVSPLLFHETQKSSLKSIDPEIVSVDQNWTNSWSHIETIDYMNLSIEVKLDVLLWSCDEFLKSSKCRSFFDEVVDDSLKKVVKSKTNGEAKQSDNDDDDEPKFKKKKSILKGNIKEAEVETFSSLSISGDDTEMFDESLRLKSLGKDRFNRVYWVFTRSDFTKADSSNSRSFRVFCEDTSTNEWSSFSDPTDLNKLIYWLCEKGSREFLLKKALLL